MAGKERFVLGLDLDGVCVDFHGGLLDLVCDWKSLNQHPYCRSTIAKQNIEKHSWFASVDDHEMAEFEEFIRVAIDENQFYANLSPIGDAIDAVADLKQDYGINITVVTNRILSIGDKKNVLTETVDWLDSWGLDYDDVCFVDDKTSVYADLYIDDSPRALHRFNQTNQPVVVYDYPYNWSIPALMRAKNWHQAKEIIIGRVN